MVTPNDIIAAASQLPPADQSAIADALLSNVMAKDFGPDEDARAVEAAWSDEIQRRLDDIDHGHVKTIPADEAERMIRSGDRPGI